MNRRTARASISFASLAFAVAACGTPRPPAPAGKSADVIIMNGRVYTGDEQGTIAQAVAIAGNTILGV